MNPNQRKTDEGERSSQPKTEKRQTTAGRILHRPGRKRLRSVTAVVLAMITGICVTECPPFEGATGAGCITLIV